MFLRLAKPEERHMIDGGRVACPLRERDVDVEQCLQCGFAREVNAEAKPAFVRCAPPRKLLYVP